MADIWRERACTLCGSAKSREERMIVECLEKGLTEKQIKRLMFRPVDEMGNYQRAYLLRNSIKDL